MSMPMLINAQDPYAQPSDTLTDLVLSPSPHSPEKIVGTAATDIPRITDTSNGSRDITRDMQTLALNNQQSFSSESELVMSSNGSFHSNSGQVAAVDTMEASGTIIPDHPQRLRRDRGSSITKPTTLAHAVVSAPAALSTKSAVDPSKEPFIPDDFLPSSFSLSAGTATPFTLISLLQEILKYHTTTMPDAQAATYFFLLISPLLSEDNSLSQGELDATITHYSEHFSSLGYSNDEIYAILQSPFDHLTKAGIQPLQIESILSAYHEQLLSLKLFNNAAHLRRIAYPTFPAVYEQALKDNQVSLMCGGCRKAINNPHNKLRCETCGTRQASCPICWCDESPFEAAPKKKKPVTHRTSQEIIGFGMNASVVSEDKERKPSLYSACMLCNHTAHAACLRTWHGTEPSLSQPGGPCPSEGCLCNCISGVRERPQQVQRRSSTNVPRVRADEVKATPSKAVEFVRGMDGQGRRAGLVL